VTSVLVIAPHADDETLGCAGTLLRHRASGDVLHWVLVTGMSIEAGWSTEQIATRAAEIKAVGAMLGFSSTVELALPPSGLDALPLSSVIEPIRKAIAAVEPNVVYLPFSGDAHGDHRVVFSAATACLKSFRARAVRRILAYETLSETEFGIDPTLAPFRPNLFVNIEGWIEQKIETMRVYASEMGTFPFPRSGEAIRALAAYRGAAAGCKAAECFMLLKDIVE
jgi:LmbE family N-acetylglucosaminyl deacetylase